MEQRTNDNQITALQENVTDLKERVAEFKLEQKESMSEMRMAQKESLDEIKLSIKELSGKYASSERVTSLEVRVKSMEDKGWSVVAAVLTALIGTAFSIYQYFIGKH